ncbi:MAG TPA: helix-turn-helix transcriptional regulator [Nocardioidaceae bacterium]|nr:helix-turn-helix transcriptional regulator [Nocardioidaceae bacterium]
MDDGIRRISGPNATDLGTSPLAALGISVASERVYRAVLRGPGLSIEQLSLTTGRSADDLRGDLEPLIERDLVRVADNIVRPEPPSFALRKNVARESRRIAEAARGLEQVEAELRRYVLEHQVSRRAAWSPVPVDVIPGPQLVEVLETLVATTSGEMLFLRPDQWRQPDGLQVDRHVVAAVSAGRPSRSIYPVAVVGAPHDSVASRVRAGERIRMLSEVPSRLAVFGGDAVVLPEQWGGGPVGAALLLRDAAIVQASRVLFEELWRRGTPVPGHDDDQAPDAERRQLLDLLAGGVKDEQIARAAGLSLRTVRRRIAALMAELGVDSRFQAGVEAARRGWL